MYNLEVLGVINHDIDSKFIHVYSFSDTYEVEDFIRGVVGVRKDAIFRLVETQTDEIKKIWRLVDDIPVEIAGYMLEICHPNEDNWKFITTFDGLGQLKDHLASPTFEVTQSLLVRCRNCQSRDFYLGCFSNGEFVSIDNESSVMQKLRYNSEARIESNKDVVSFWRDSKSGNVMLTALENSMPIVDKIRVARNMMSLVQEYIPMNLHYVLEGDPKGNEGGSIDRAINATNGSTRRALEALRSYWTLAIRRHGDSSLANIQYYVQECLIFARGGAVNATRNRFDVMAELSNFIRAQIPLHLMLEWVTRK